ncbi:hypothetical protein [Xanthomonas sp. GPE 39]|uniref:hypothetical protein n=1 Tax=Xanthomonas sp. GPE 39 TaxID=1583099 RepID=UPI00126A6E7E|nr:hypothetical protein [Xanthomonas sp. GPE 39]
MAITELKGRAQQAQEILHLARKAVADLGLKADERVATSLPLVLASMDHADTILVLLCDLPYRFWLSSLVLQRTQMEYVLRAAFFAKAASENELRRFRAKGKMPNRGESKIHLGRMAEEAIDHLGWEDKENFLASVRAHQRQLSTIVHGGKEILLIYTKNKEWGSSDADGAKLAGSIDTVLVYVMVAMAVVMSLSPLDNVQIDAVVRPAFEAFEQYSKFVNNPIEDECHGREA